MYSLTIKGPDALVEEYHLCVICYKMFCCNTTPFVWLRRELGTATANDDYAHKECVYNPPPPPRQMIGETR